MDFKSCKLRGECELQRSSHRASTSDVCGDLMHALFFLEYVSPTTVFYTLYGVLTVIVEAGLIEGSHIRV